MKYQLKDKNDPVEKACDDIRRIVTLFHTKEYSYDDYFGNDICNDLCDIEQGYRKLKQVLEIIKDEFQIDFDDDKQNINLQSIEEPYTHIRFSLTRKIKDKDKYDSLKEELECV